MTAKPSKSREADNAPAPDSRPDVSALNLVEFTTLTNGTNEVIIEYQGQQYRLRATRNGKLILNK